MKRHEITEADVALTPVVTRLASACGPNGSKRLEVRIDINTEVVTFLMNGKEYAWLRDAIEAYNEAPGP